MLHKDVLVAGDGGGRHLGGISGAEEAAAGTDAFLLQRGEASSEHLKGNEITSIYQFVSEPHLRMCPSFRGQELDNLAYLG
jgi:hypothetical protein